MKVLYGVVLSVILLAPIVLPYVIDHLFRSRVAGNRQISAGGSLMRLIY